MPRSKAPAKEPESTSAALKRLPLDFAFHSTRMDGSSLTLQRGQRNFLCVENKTSMREGPTLQVLLSAPNQLENMFRNQSRRKSKTTIPTASTLDYRSELVTERLGRIAVHYEQLEIFLAELEAKLPAESAETAMPQTIAENLPTKPR